MISLSAGRSDGGMRLDRFLRQSFPSESLSRLSMILRKKKVRVNGKRAKVADRLCEGDRIEIYENLETGTVKKNENTVADDFLKKNLKILHRESGLLVLDKPSGIAAQPGTACRKGESLVELLHAFLGQEEKRRHRASLLHRLDRETSGLVLACEDPLLLRELSAVLRERRLDKRYLALVAGSMPEKSGRIELCLDRKDAAKGSKVQVNKEGKFSRTDWKVLAECEQFSLLEICLHTGRMHQIRTHMAHLEHPLLGDRRYGDFPLNGRIRREYGFSRLFLHAWKLRLPLNLEHYSGKSEFFAALPPNLRKLVGCLFDENERSRLGNF